MDSWFIRHWPKHSQWTAKENQGIHDSLFNKKWIAIHYESIASWESDDYHTSKGKSAIRLFDELRMNGGIVCADYPAIGKMYVGEVRKGQLQNSQQSKLTSKKPILKYLKLYKARKVSGHARIFFRTLAGQGTVHHWPSLHLVLRYFYKHGNFPCVREALLPAQLETICQEYLRDNHGMSRLLWPIGRSMPDVDIVGINKKGKNIYAQVTHAETCAKLEPKLDRLLSYKGKGVLVFFCPQSDDSKTMQKKYPFIKFIWSDQKVWKWLRARKNKKYIKSLLSWLS